MSNEAAQYVPGFEANLKLMPQQANSRLVQGVLADHIGLQHAFFLPLLCYLYIVFYGISGSKIRSSVD